MAGLPLLFLGAASPLPACHLAGAVPLGAPNLWGEITFDPAASLVSITHGGEVVRVDATKLSRVGTVPTVPETRASARDAKTGDIAVSHGARGTLTLTDRSGHATTLGINETLGDVAADGAGHVFVGAEETRRVLRIDVATARVQAAWPIEDCLAPQGMAVDAAGRLFVACRNQRVLVLDAGTGRVIATVPTGRGSRSVAVDAARHRVLVANSEGTLSVIDAALVVGKGCRTAPGAGWMALDPATGRIFVATAEVVFAEKGEGEDAPPALTFAPGTAKLMAFDAP